MTYYEQASKEKLREYQKKSAEARNRNNRERFKTAAIMRKRGTSIATIAGTFNVTKRGVYKMIQKGKKYVQ